MLHQHANFAIKTKNKKKTDQKKKECWKISAFPQLKVYKSTGVRWEEEFVGIMWQIAGW